MSVLRNIALPLALTAVLLGGCDKKFADDSKVLATVNGEKITEKDFENYLQLRQNQQEPIADKEKERKLVVDELIDRVVLAQHGSALGYEKESDVYFRLKRVRENVLAQEVIRKSFTQTPVTDDDVKKRFETEIEKTNKNEYKTRHILVKSEEDAQDVAKKLKSGSGFEQLAKTRSTDAETAKRGGDLGWVSQGTGFVPEFFNTLMTLQKGQVSDPVKSEFGWHVIKVDDIRPLKLPTFEEFMTDPRAPASLRRRIQEERLQDMLKELKTKAKIVTTTSS